ncbi:hypothetical protein HanIR_Chr06g0271221 [Helianthus annuus]|nr:hypothetical protein HanIR_Chr06g0271221 [Helianthus annuus]
MFTIWKLQLLPFYDLQSKNHSLFYPFFVNNFIDNIIITSTIYLLVKLITHPQVWSVSIWLGCASCPVF